MPTHMKTIVYTEHLINRLKVRKIPKNYPIQTYKNPDEEYYDIIEKNHIRIKQLEYNKKSIKLMIAFQENQEQATIITIHPIDQAQINNRIIKGRWIKNEIKI